MINLFNVSDINFIENSSDNEILRFTPKNNLYKNSDNKELIKNKKFFTEDITITPAVKNLIESPTPLENNDEIAEKIKAYPYKKISEIYDYSCVIWKKILTGTVTETADEQYTFDGAGVQANGIINLEKNFNMFLKVKILDDSQNRNFINIYQNLNTASTNYPSIHLYYDQKEFRITRRKTNNGTLETATKKYIKKFPTNSIANFIWTYFDNGITFLYDKEEQVDLCELTTTSNIRPTNIRIAVGPSGTSPATSNIEIQKFFIEDFYGNIISQWNKEGRDF